jgi:hypothetical protein
VPVESNRYYLDQRNGRVKRGKRQDWTPGNVVRVGFMQLRILGYQAVKDYLPDIYTLSNLAGDKYYEFVPHNGVIRIEKSEAFENMRAKNFVTSLPKEVN